MSVDETEYGLNPFPTENTNLSELFVNNFNYSDSLNFTITETHYTVTTKRDYTNVVVMFVISLTMIVLLNARVICILSRGVCHRQLDPVNLLMINMSSVAIGFTLLVGVYVGEKLNMIPVNGAAKCKLLGFTSNTLGAVLSLNILLIVYESISTSLGARTGLLAKRVIPLLWIFAICENIPCIFDVGYEVDPTNHVGKCKPIPIFGSVAVTLASILVAFFFQHLLPVGFMCYAIFQIRHKITLLCYYPAIHNRRLQGAVKNLRFIYLYSFLFIFVWMPTGFFKLSYKLLGRIGKDYSSFRRYMLPVYIFNYTYLILSPTIFVCFSKDFSLCRLSNCKCECCECDENGIDPPHTQRSLSENNESRV